jgi:hypothetical protein
MSQVGWVGVQIKLVGDPFSPLHLSYSEVNTEIGYWVSKRNREKKEWEKEGLKKPGFRENR